MKLPAPKRPPLPPEWPTIRADLCRRVDFPALLAGDGVQVQRNGRGLVCSIRDERTPSCHLYPPGVGRSGEKGWTWHDYGSGKGGDALGYLVDVRGMDFLAAARLLAERGGWVPDCLRDDYAPRAYTPTPKAKDTPPATIHTPEPEPMPADMQWTACASFLSALAQIDPNAQGAGEDYLRGRGVSTLAGVPVAYLLRRDVVPDLAAALADLAATPNAPDFVRAGLLKPDEAGKPPRLPWWGDCVLLVCHDSQACPVYIVARRLDWAEGNRAGKYINQPCPPRGPVRWPFNLPALYASAGRLPGWPITYKTRDVLLVEGPLDALGAAALGWPAVALLNRPQAHDYKDQHGAAARMLDAHLPALRDVDRVRVVPDADPGPKGAEGEALASRLVCWLRDKGCRADVARLADLCPDAPDWCKDLADVAKATTKESPPC